MPTKSVKIKLPKKKIFKLHKRPKIKLKSYSKKFRNVFKNNLLTPEIIIGLVSFLLIIIGSLIALFLVSIDQDLRQQADSGAYSTESENNPTVASSVEEPTTGEFGWNYTTGQASTTEDWSNTDLKIAGTYIHCKEGECKRYVVNLKATHDALKAYSESHKKEDATCTQNLGGVCVAWKENKKPEPTKKQVDEIKETEEEKDETNEGSRCNQTTDCTGGTVCAYSPYGAFCVKQENAGKAEILIETETIGEKIPTNSLGYSSSAECTGRCDTECGGPGGTYCLLPEPNSNLEDELCVGSWCGHELDTSEEKDNPEVKEPAEETTEVDENIITKEDYEACRAINTPAECRNILDHLGELIPTSRPTTEPTIKVTPNNKEYKTSLDCISNCKGTCSGIKGNICNQFFPEQKKINPPKIDLEEISNKKIITQNDYDECLKNGNTHAECKNILDHLGELIPATRPTIEKIKPTEKPLIEIEETNKKQSGEKCTPLFSQCENKCNLDLKLGGFYCSGKENTPNPTPTSKPEPTEKPTPEPTISISFDHLPDWNESCHQTCQPGLSCTDGKCLADCPTNPKGECEYSNLVCEDTRNRIIDKTEGKLKKCTDGEWKNHGNTLISFGDSCSESDINAYRESLSKIQDSLLIREHLKIECEEPRKIEMIDPKTGDTYISTACGGFAPGEDKIILGKKFGKEDDTIYLSCTYEECINEASGYNCNYVIAHELGHNQSMEISLFGEVESFNKAVGCRSVGKEGNYTFSEYPVTSYGETHCSEAHAELIATYSQNPCYIKESGKFPKQYDWLITSDDSPFKGQDLCVNEPGAKR